MTDGPRRQARPQPYPVDPGSGSSAGNWLMRGIAAVAGAVVLIAAVFVGMVMFFVLLGLLALVALVGVFRIWSLRRRFRRQYGPQGRNQDEATGTGSSGRGWMQTEYVVMRHRNGRPEYHRHVSRREFGNSDQPIEGEHERIEEERDSRR